MHDFAKVNRVGDKENRPLKGWIRLKQAIAQIPSLFFKAHLSLKQHPLPEKYLRPLYTNLLQTVSLSLRALPPARLCPGHSLEHDWLPTFPKPTLIQALPLPKVSADPSSPSCSPLLFLLITPWPDALPWTAPHLAFTSSQSQSTVHFPLLPQVDQRCLGGQRYFLQFCILTGFH